MQQARHLAATLLALFALAAAGLGSVHAQTSPAQPGVPGTTEMPIEDYLALLARIAPAAHDGARAYRQAWQQRCGRSLTTAELRVAMAVGDGFERCVAVAPVDREQPDLARDVLALARRKVVEHGDLEAGLERVLDDVTADETGAAGD